MRVLKIDLLTDEDLIAIGRCAVSFGALEHQLAQALIAIYGGPQKIEEGTLEYETIIDSIEGGFGKRLSLLVEAHDKKYPNNPHSSDFAEKLGVAKKWRDHFAHSLWEPIGDKLSATMWKRNRRKPKENEAHLTLQELGKIDESNRLNILMLEDFIREEEGNTEEENGTSN